MRIRVDQEKARQLGVSSEQVSRSLASALSGRTVTQFRDDIYLIDVQGRAQARDRGDLAHMRDLEIGIARRQLRCRSRRSRRSNTASRKP